MKKTIGKIGLGLAGAFAFAGLMSAGIPLAEAQLELVPAPGGTGSNANPQYAQSGNDWIYTYTLAIVNPVGSQANFTVSANGTLGSLNPVSASTPPGGVADPGGYANSAFQIQDFYGYDSLAQGGLDPLGQLNSSVAGTTSISTAGSWELSATGTTLNVYWVGDSATGTGAGYYNGTTMSNTGSGGYTSVTVAPGTSTSGNNTVFLGFFQFASTFGPGNLTTPPIYNFNSSLNVGTTTTGTGGSRTAGNPQQVDVPVAPLPAAFWPGLLTLGGMAVVGGLRLRRRTV